jgi:hypothetical protein
MTTRSQPDVSAITSSIRRKPSDILRRAFIASQTHSDYHSLAEARGLEMAWRRFHHESLIAMYARKSALLIGGRASRETASSVQLPVPRE